MLSFFKSKKNKDSTIVVEQEIDTNQDEGNQEEVRPTLSLHPLWNIPNEKKYVFSFLNQELQPLLPNQLSLSTIDVIVDEANIIVSAFVRNSLKKALSLQDTTILLLDEEDHIISKKTFKLQEMGDLPPSTSRPWNFTFPIQDAATIQLGQNLKLAFELKSKHKLDLEPSWEESLPPEQKAKLEALVDQLTPPNESEVNFMGLNIQFAENKSLSITILIRNGRRQTLTIEQLPLQVIDANGDIVAKGGFKLNNLTIKANSTKPWTLIFPQELVLKENPDFTKWKVEVLQG